MSYFLEPLDLLLRSLALRRMVEFEDPEYVAEGRRRFENLEAGNVHVPADVRVAIYKSLLSSGGQASVDRLLNVRFVQ